MNKEEYYKRLEKTTEKIKTDRCSEDDIANINRQKLYLAEHYISNLQQENKKYKEVIDKAIDLVEKLIKEYKLNYGDEPSKMLLAYETLLNTLREVE